MSLINRLLVKVFFETILIVFAGFIFQVSGQISPGDLTTAHAKLEGMSNCTKCHVLGEKVVNSKCLDCHTEIKDLIEKGKGYHSSIDVREKDCFKCHSEHNGRDFRIINFDPKNFNHDKTGYILSGKHAKIACDECHQPKFISNQNIKRVKNTYLGLTENCFTCHEDYHQNTLGNECSSCHNTFSFKPASNFNHSLTAFRLTGAHEKVECSKCHIKEERNGKDFQVFKGVLFESCESCHEDIHKGKFGKDCKSCHSTESFKDIDRKEFDHNKTNFALAGKHITVTCSKCHKEGLIVKIKYQRCFDCHSDYHNGDFIKNGIMTDCSGCHTVFGFQPSTFTIEKHDSTSFKLTGGHLAVSCQSCHHKEKDWHFSNIGNRCIDCHKNVHRNEITEKFMPGDNCLVCHSTENWKRISFDHSSTKFILEGRHKITLCSECHYKTEESGEKVFRFVSLKSDCKTCHKDIHFGQFEVNGISDCGRCHNFDNWSPSKFDHDKTNFSLTGAHKNLDCSKCHKKNEENGNIFIKYKLEDYKCAACHS